LSSAAFIFGPAFGKLMKEGIFFLEKEERKMRHMGRHEEEPPNSESSEEGWDDQE